MSQVQYRQVAYGQRRSDRMAALNRVHFRRREAFVGIPDVSGKRWFVVKTNPQCEERAEEAIRCVGYDTYCPVYRRRLFDERTKKRIHKTQPVFVGYVFVLMPETNPDVGLIRECDGVKEFLPVREDRPPISFHDHEIEVLRRIEATQWLLQDVAFRARSRRFKPGRGAIPQLHVIAEGAFEGFLGIIKAQGREGTVEMVTQAFGAFEQVVLPVDRVLPSA